MKRYALHHHQLSRRRPDSERWSAEHPLWQRLRSRGSRSVPIEIHLLEDEEPEDQPEER